MGTIAMTAEEVGAYIRLLCVQWDIGGLPNDDSTICRLGGCGGNAVASIRAKFEVGQDGKLRNRRLEEEREKQRIYREKQAENGAKRWLGNAKPQALAKPSHMPEGMPNGCSPSPSPSPSSDSDSNISYGEKKVSEKTSHQIRAEKLFRRRESTPWDKATLKAWAGSKPAIEATPEDEWKLLEWFYSIPEEGTFRRKDLATLLNNWTAEIDRARAHRGSTVNGKKQHVPDRLPSGWERLPDGSIRPKQPIGKPVEQETFL